MNNIKYSSLLILLASFSCADNLAQKEQWKQEIVEAEESFAALALDEGISTAFLTYASEDAVLSRNNQIIDGRENIKIWFESRPHAAGSSLSWKPDFVDVSSSGDLGYTYGKYQFTSLDSLGNPQTSSGIFHTVWKRQKDGSWKFVWD